MLNICFTHISRLHRSTQILSLAQSELDSSMVKSSVWEVKLIVT
jgi:hypothetical protein